MKIALTNVPPDECEHIARSLVEEHAAACVNLYPIRSFYFWKDEVHFDEEYTLMMKVSSKGVENLKKRLFELHPYELPAFIVLEVDTEASLAEYVQYVRDGTHS